MRGWDGNFSESKSIIPAPPSWGRKRTWISGTNCTWAGEAEIRKSLIMGTAFDKLLWQKMAFVVEVPLFTCE